MSNKPDTYLEAVNAAQLFQRYGIVNDTRSWDYTQRQTYYNNGGK